MDSVREDLEPRVRKLVLRLTGAGRGGLWLALGVAVLGVTMLYLSQASIVATSGYEIRDLEQQRDQLLIRNEQARLSVEALRSSERVEREALRLGLRPAERVTVLQADRAPVVGSVARYETNGSLADRVAGWAGALLRSVFAGMSDSSMSSAGR